MHGREWWGPLTCANALKHRPASAGHASLVCAGLKAADGVQKSVRIVITSGMVNQGRFSRGLRDSLEPRVQQARSQPLGCRMLTSVKLP